MQSVAVIGAGLAGITLANQLHHLFNVRVFDKHHAPGGRITARGAQPYSFDHGAQYIRVKSPVFRQVVDELLKAGVLAPWDAQFIELTGSEVTKRTSWGAEHAHYVGVPDNRAVAAYLSRDLDVRFNKQVKVIKHKNQQWQLFDDQHNLLGSFDWVITALPVKQAATLLSTAGLTFDVLSQVKMQACYALMLGYTKPLSLPFDATMMKDDIISWVSNNGSKPQRGDGFSLLINSTNDWADAHLDGDDAWVTETLINRASECIQQDLSNPAYCELKRWHYANCTRQLHQQSLLDTQHKVGLCGDWFISGRIESAFFKRPPPCGANAACLNRL